MISSTELSLLITGGKYERVESILSVHFNGKDKDDLASAQKTANLTTFGICQEKKKCSVTEFRMLLKYFLAAMAVVVNAKSPPVQKDIEKMLGYFGNVSQQSLTFEVS